jgi:diamine N-acetyltransferase
VVLVRKAEQKDIAALRDLAIRVFSETFASDNNPDDFKAYVDEAFSIAKIESEFSESGSQFFVSVQDNTLSGYARVRENPEVNHILGHNHLELQRLYVASPWQGKGAAGKLMEACEAFALQGKKDWLWLGVWEFNPKGQHFYIKHGFEKFSEHTFVLGTDPQTDWLMRKPLSTKNTI